MLGHIFRIAALVALFVFGASAHVGSPDIYLEAQAGPYKLFITVRPPTVIPGVAELEIRSETPGVRQIRAVPLPMSGPGAQFAPVPDTLTISPQDPQFFTGTLWMMASGSWQVKVTATGQRGSGMVAVPVPSVATSTKTMQAGLGALLSVLMSFLVLGIVAIVGASLREVKLAPGVAPDETDRRRGRIGMLITFAVVVAVIWYGRHWWNTEAASYSQNVYKPLRMSAVTSGNMLMLTLSEPGWLESRNLEAWAQTRAVDDLIPDHGHLMHLYVIREPGLDVVYHLHPEARQGGVFAMDLPTIPAGNYKLYADIVHQSGFPETLVASLRLPGRPGRALAGDDAMATADAWQQSAPVSKAFRLPDGYRMEWIPPSGALRAKQAVPFQLRLLDPSGKVPSDMALYMGMLGHAAFMKTDGSVFAHIHPAGTVSMAAFDKAQGQSSGADDAMAGMDMSPQSGLPNRVSFPYGLPTPGRYRVFVQMKHGDVVETGVFDMQAN
jgi:hypothetical protein